MNSTPPPGLIASAEQDYQGLQVRVAEAVAAARLLLVGRSTEVEVLADVYWMLRRAEPRIAAGIGAAAIVQLAKQTESEATGDGPADKGVPDRGKGVG